MGITRLRQKIKCKTCENLHQRISRRCAKNLALGALMQSKFGTIIQRLFQSLTSKISDNFLQKNAILQKNIAFNFFAKNYAFIKAVILAITLSLPKTSSIGKRSGPPACPDTAKRIIWKYSFAFFSFF